MRITHVIASTLDTGAARGATILSDAMRGIGVDSRVLCLDDDGWEGDSPTYAIADNPLSAAAALARSKADAWPARLLRRKDRGLFSLGLAGIDLRKLEVIRNADLVHLHWVNRGTVSIAGMGRLPRPLVWTLRDMWLFTGGCHYSLGCSRFEATCGACPVLGSRRERDLSTWVQHRKRHTMPEHPVYVGISQWLTDKACASSLLRDRDVRHIPNAVDCQAFRPMPKEQARRALSLPPDRPIVLHGALDANDEYKGSHHLHDTIARVQTPGVFVASFGAGSEQHWVARSFGMVRDDALLRTIYSAADVLVFPSVQEAFGKVVGEALACGTPAVVFRDTGPAEIVDHERTGYVARSGDPGDLARGIDWILSHPSPRRLGEDAAADVVARFSPTRLAHAYRTIYEECLSNGR